MSLFHLIRREIGHRPLSFGLALLAVAAAAGCLVGAMALLRAHDLRTEELIAQAGKDAEKDYDKLRDQVRKITKGLGFNVLILPQDQSVAEFLASGSVDVFMTEADARKLAEKKLVTINHCLPILQRRVAWPERNQTVSLLGIRGEIYVKRKTQAPLLEQVEPGRLVVGYELHHGSGLKEGQEITFQGRPFRVHRLESRRGNEFDITVLMNLDDAQRLLNKPGQISGIYALSCECPGDPYTGIKMEVTARLPGVQVVFFKQRAEARAQARAAADALIRSRTEATARDRAGLKTRREETARIVVILVVGVSCVWVGLTLLVNVRERRGEIGILRALGLTTGQIQSLFLMKAVAIGLIGAIAGAAAGWLAAASMGEGAAVAGGSTALLDGKLVGLVVLAAPAIAALASWLPAQVAAGQDPAVVLREE